MSDVYVEFPVDNIVAVHWADDDDGGGGPDPEEEEYICGEYLFEVTYTVGQTIPPFGSEPGDIDEWLPYFYCFLTEGGIYFNPNSFRLPPAGQPPYSDPRDVPMSGVIRYEIERTMNIVTNFDGGRPGGEPVNVETGCGMGLSIMNSIIDPTWQPWDIGKGPQPPNLATGNLVDLLDVGQSETISVSASHELERMDTALFRMDHGYGHFVHNIHSEHAPPNGWAFVGHWVIYSKFRITGICKGPH